MKTRFDTAEYLNVCLRLFFVFILILSFTNQTYAGDPKLTGKLNIFSNVFRGHAIALKAEVENTEAFPATNLDFSVQVIDLATDQLLFSSTTQTAIFGAQTTMFLTTGPNNLWIPGVEENVFIQIEIFSPDDINLTNNSYSTTVNVIDPQIFSTEFDQIDFLAPFAQLNSSTGILHLDLPPIQDDPLFININAMNPDNDGQEPAIWIAQNIPYLPFSVDQLISTWFDLGPLGIENGVDIDFLDIGISLTSGPLTAMPTLDMTRFELGIFEYEVYDDNEVLIEPDIPLTIPELVWDQPSPITWHYRGCEVPNENLDSFKNGVTADYAGDKNACGPVSAANSMHWLEENDDNITSTGTTTREKLKELSGFMDRENEKGVTTEQMLKGKLAYIDEHKLPIRVKYQSYFNRDSSYASPNGSYGHSAENQSDSIGKPPTFEWIKNEMENGEDVELMFGWYDAAGNRHGGHWVALSGVSDVGTGKGFYFKDDAKQGDSTGLRQTYVNWVDGDNGWGRLVGLKGANNNCWVESAISESYDSTVTFVDPAADPGLTGILDLFSNVIRGIPIALRAEVENTEAFPATSLDFIVTIYDFNEDTVLFTSTTRTDTLAAQTTMFLTTGPNNLWTPGAEERVLIRFEISSPDDINTANNSVFKLVDVVDPPPFGLEFDQIDFLAPFAQLNSSTGILHLDLPPIQDDPLFINVTAINPNGPSTSIWIAQNIPYLPFSVDQLISTWFDLDPLGIENGVDIDFLDIGVSLTSDPLTVKPTPAMTSYELGIFEYEVYDDNEVLIEPDIPLTIPELVWDQPSPITWHYRGCEVPNENLDSSKNGVTADYAGDKNACGPVSAANSMHWLEENDDNITSTGTTTREKLKELSGFMDRENEKGVTTEQMLKGKLAYIDEHKLPIRVKYQSYFNRDSSYASPNGSYGHSAENQSDSIGKPPTFEWIKNEMENGEDVELMFGWYDAAGNRHGGHWVALSGVSDVGTEKGFYFKDDAKQGDSTGLRQTYVNWVDGDNGWGRLVGLKGANNNCWVESAISESYDSTVTFELTTIDEVNGIDPFGLNIYQNPSLVNDAITISFNIDQACDVSIHIVDMFGKVIYKKEINFTSFGNQSIHWDGQLINGGFTKPGMYIATMRACGKESHFKFIRR